MLYLHPFAEEMNRARRMAALQARALAAAGHGVLLLDLSGCGESTGDFADAGWERWVEDAEHAIDWLANRGGGPVTLWGLRLGATLAAQVAHQHADLVARLVLWQPVSSGKTMLTRFLRIRVAAAMTGGGQAETTKVLRQALADGSRIEVAGYELTPELTGAIDGVDLLRLVPPRALPVHWLEVVPGTQDAVSPGSQRIIESWRDEGSAAAVDTVTGEPFWSIQETTVVPELIARTTRLFELECVY